LTEDNEDVKVTIEDIPENDRNARNYSYGVYSIVKGLIGLIAGLILIIRPQMGIRAVSVILGVFFLSEGIFKMILVFKIPQPDGREVISGALGALLKIIIGILLIAYPGEAGEFWVSFIFITSGLGLMISSFFVFWTNSRAVKDPSVAFSSIIMLMLGVVLVFVPLGSARFVLRVLGAVLIFSSVQPLIYGIKSYSRR